MLNENTKALQEFYKKTKRSMVNGIDFLRYAAINFVFIGLGKQRQLFVPNSTFQRNCSELRI
jgi:hypothetical protein